MTDLMAWLRAQMDADERPALAAAARYVAPDGQAYWPLPSVRARFRDADDGIRAGLELIASHDPARVLRQVAAMRAIVDACEYTLDYEDYGWPLARDVLRHLATMYADRDGYQPEWAPE